jgi:hypothetical protein
MQLTISPRPVFPKHSVVISSIIQGASDATQKLKRFATHEIKRKDFQLVSSLLFRFTNQIFIRISHLSHKFYMPCPCHCYCPNNIWRGLQIMKRNTVRLPSVSSYFLPLRFKYFVDILILNTLNLCSSFNLRNQVPRSCNTSAGKLHNSTVHTWAAQPIQNKKSQDCELWICDFPSDVPIVVVSFHYCRITTLAPWRCVEIICTDDWWVSFMSSNRCILHSKLWRINCVVFPNLVPHCQTWRSRDGRNTKLALTSTYIHSSIHTSTEAQFNNDCYICQLDKLLT